MATRGFDPRIDPKEFDLDLTFNDRVSGDGFVLQTLDEGCLTKVCPKTGCICAGATDIDTGAGGTCVARCFDTRVKTCLRVEIETLRELKCVKVYTLRKIFGCLTHNNFGCPSPVPGGTNSPECG